MTKNLVVLEGLLTKDLEIKYSSKGMCYVMFTVAVKEYKDDDTNFISCKAFGEVAEQMGNSGCGKGSIAMVVGKLKTGSFQNKQGQKVYTTDVIADMVVLKERNSKHYAKKEDDSPDFGKVIADKPDGVDF